MHIKILGIYTALVSAVLANHLVIVGGPFDGSLVTVGPNGRLTLIHDLPQAITFHSVSKNKRFLLQEQDIQMFVYMKNGCFYSRNAPDKSLYTYFTKGDTINGGFELQWNGSSKLVVIRLRNDGGYDIVDPNGNYLPGETGVSLALIG